MRKGILMGERRSSFEIIYNILCEARQGINKTRLVYKTNLNFHVMQRYIEFLMTKELLCIEYKPHVKYKTTEKGLKYIESFEHMTRNILKLEDSSILEFELL
jgi:predicted transcriptional regulator